jgi:hypothetical protein
VEGGRAGGERSTGMCTRRLSSYRNQVKQKKALQSNTVVLPFPFTLASSSSSFPSCSPLLLLLVVGGVEKNK